MELKRMHKKTTPINIVEKAFIAGVIPILTFEKMRIGRVVAPGPDKKLAITRSSKDREKAKTQAASKDLLIIGIVIIVKTRKGVAPKLIAACSIDGSKLIILDLTVI